MKTNLIDASVRVVECAGDAMNGRALSGDRYVVRALYVEPAEPGFRPQPMIVLEPIHGGQLRIVKATQVTTERDGR